MASEFYDERGELVAPPALREQPISIPSGISSGPRAEAPLPPGVGIVGRNVVDVGVDRRTPSEWAAITERFNAFDRAQRDAEAAANMEALLTQSLRANQTAATVGQAVQYQEMRALQRAIDSGVPFEQAASRHFRAFGTGRDAAAMLRETRPTPAPSVLELQGIGPAVRSGRYGERVSFPPVSALPMDAAVSEVADPATGARIGLSVPTGPRSRALVRDTADPAAKQEAAWLNARINQRQRQLDAMMGLTTEPYLTQARELAAAIETDKRAARALTRGADSSR